MFRKIIWLLVCTGPPSISAGTVLNVPTLAYPTIQSAIQAAAAGDEVVVAPGVYDEAISFGATAITVRSSGGSAVTTIDASGLGLRVVIFRGSSPATQLSGFTITGGQQLGTEPQDRGAGIYCDQASPTINDCIVEGNLAVFGGGLATWLGNPTVTNCVFRNNRATFRGGAVANSSADPDFDQCTFQLNQADLDGGAMANINSSPTLTDCIVEQNSAGLLAGGMYSQGSNLVAADPTITGCTFRFNGGVLGGGIYSSSHSHTAIRDSLFAQNSSQKGAGVFISGSSHLDVSGCVFDANTASDRGGAIFVDIASVTVSDSLFVDNTATFFGGAVSHAFSEGSIYKRNRFIANSSRDGGAAFAREGSNPQFVNCLFNRNHAARGGAIAVVNATSSAVNCTFVANVAEIKARTLYNNGGSVSLTNCIMRNGGIEIVEDGAATTTVAYSNVEGSWPGVGNIDENPRFVDADGPDDTPGTEDDNLRLTTCSPGVEVGDNTGVPPGVTTDLDGNPRFFDADADTIATVDMGAYELQQLLAPDPLEACPNPWAPDPEGGKLNRTGCFKMPASAVAACEETAIRVRMVDLYIDSTEDPANGCPVRTEGNDLSAFENQVRYLGPPSAFDDNDTVVTLKFIAAELQCTPLVRDWTPAALAVEFPGADTSRIYYYGKEVFPCSIHEAQQATQACINLGSENCFSTSLEIRTALWGDVWPDFGLVNFTDLGKVVDAFKSIPFLEGPPPDGAPRKVRAMVRGNTAPLDSAINFTDIGNVVNAFKTIAYAEDGPTACP